MSSAVLHGRRRGQAKGGHTPEHDFPLPSDIPLGMQLADGTDLRQVTVLSKGDWERIHNQLNRRQIEQAKIQRMKAEREELKNRSKELVKNWGNTIVGQRQRKLEARKLREQKEEEERYQIDIEEVQFQAEKRREAIEKAKTQQYYQTDRVKGFHGALLLTEVLKEREAQIELKQLKQKANLGKDQEWLDKARAEYEEGIKTDQEKARDRNTKRLQNSAFQDAQILEHNKQREDLAREDRQEGEDLKKLAIQYQIERERLDNLRRDERKNLMSDNVQQIRDVSRLKELHTQQDEEENEECRVFAQAKRKMMTLRAEKEHKLHEEKQASLEKIREKLGAQMKQKVDDEDDRITRASEELEAKKATEDRQKDEKMRRLTRESAEHRYQQMKELEEKRKEAKMEEYEMIRIRTEADNIFRDNEEEKQRRNFLQARELADFHNKQADEQRGKERSELDYQLALDRKNVDLLAIEEAQFQEYANNVIDHCQRAGRNVYPLHKAAKEGAGGGAGPIFNGKGGLRPSYMVSDNSGKQLPNYQGDSTEETKQAIYGKSKSKNRLGFVW